MKKIFNNKIIYSAFILLFTVGFYAQTGTENYVKKTVYKTKTTNGTTTLNGDNLSINDSQESITYFDGLGRAKQSVMVRASGIVNNQNAVSYDWTEGNTGATDFFNQNGYPHESAIVNGQTPFGSSDLLWECIPDTSVNADGGWNTDYFEIDNTKSYRYTIWVKKTGSIANPTSGRTYHGIQNVNNLDGSFNTNPYFVASSFLPEVDTWYLLVGVVHPKDYQGADTDLSGVYDTEGNKISDGLEFKWSTNHTSIRLRNFLYYCSDISVRQYFWSPLFQKIDGTELSLNEVFTTSNVIVDGETTNDIVTHIEYDEFGRQTKEYLPYVASSSDGSFKAGEIATTTNAFYQEKYPEDFAGVALPDINAYSEKALEDSPLNRIVEQTAPGAAWKISETLVNAKGYSTANSIKLEYQTNTETEVKQYTATTSYSSVEKIYIPSLEANNGYYNAGELYKTVTKDENWQQTQANAKDHTTEEFKNKSGQVVLKRTYGKSVVNGVEQNSIAHDTYYVYDDYGNLTYVLPPKVNTSVEVSNSELDELCYQYKYDTRNRLVEKKIPGKGWEYIVYDKLDRPVLTQDALQAQTQDWLFTKYDVLGRVIATGKFHNGRDRINMQVLFEDVFPQNIYEDKTTSSLSVNGVVFNYTNRAYPTDGANTEYYTFNYYDEYTGVLPTSLSPSITTSYGTPSTTRTKGLATVSKVRVLGTNSWTTTVSYYDDKARPIYSYSKNDYLQTTDIVENKLEDFTGKLLETKTTHQKTGKSDIVTIDNFEYDHMDRLLVQNQKINNQLSKRLVKNNYDELGQLESKLVGSGTKQGYKDVSSGIRVTDDAITKIGGASWSVGLATQGSFDADGYVSFSPTQQNRYYMVGLSNVNLDAHYSTIGYAIYLVHTSNVHIFESGISKGTKTTYQIGDVFKVERIGTEIHYKKNGETFYISETPSSGSLIGDISMVHTGAKIKDFHIVDNAKGLQKVDYNYNVRGWLKNINQDANDDNDLFNFSLRYNDATDPNKALFNGNISETSWNTLNQDTSVKTYSYLYDALNRITRATGANTSNYDLKEVLYDKNGNITSLTRNGHLNTEATSFGMMDDLRYHYDNGNKLITVDDKSDIEQGFKDGNVNSEDYTYDANGNMVSDANKGIASITYNHLNLPVKVTFAEQKYIEYAYDASGMKLQKLVNNLGNITATNYASNGAVYENGVLQFIPNAEGYTKYNTGTFQNVYQYKDHLGNVRLSYADTNNDGEITASSEIIEEKNYYPFGLQHKGYNNVVNSNGNSVAQKFGYNGMELEESLGLDLYEMDVRSYDPAIARWTGIDPITHHSMSPYVAFDNNPIYFSDPSGADAEDPVKSTTIIISSSVDQHNVTTINQTTRTSTTVTNEDGSTTESFTNSTVTNTVDAEGNVTNGTTATERSGTTTTDANGDSSTSMGKTTTRNLNKGEKTSSLNKWTNKVSNFNKNNYGTFNQYSIEKGSELVTFAGKAGTSIFSVHVLGGKLGLDSATKKLIGLGGGTYTADGLISKAGSVLEGMIGKGNNWSIIYDLKTIHNGNLIKDFKEGANGRKDVSPIKSFNSDKIRRIIKMGRQLKYLNFFNK